LVPLYTIHFAKFLSACLTLQSLENGFILWNYCIVDAFKLYFESVTLPANKFWIGKC
jgi:hypothetical protein